MHILRSFPKNPSHACVVIVSFVGSRVWTVISSLPMVSAGLKDFSAGLFDVGESTGGIHRRGAGVVCCECARRPVARRGEELQIEHSHLIPVVLITNQESMLYFRDRVPPLNIAHG